ncbi:MAG: sulfotransferase, partial [Gaiellaceae bacterium]
PERTLTVRYESLAESASELAAFLSVETAPLEAALERFHDRSVGRWRRDLTSDQLADLEAEAGELLAELGYA